MKERKRFVREFAVGPRGFSKWVNPKMRGYLMACCDCGLVHEMQFKAFRIVKRLRSGAKEVQLLPSTQHGILFRARRAAGHTAKLRTTTGQQP